MSLVPIDGRTSRYHEKDLSTVKELFNEKKKRRTRAKLDKTYYARKLLNGGEFVVVAN